MSFDPLDHDHVIQTRPRSRGVARSAVGALLAAFVVVLATASASLAASPSNDDAATATALTSFPVHLAVDMNEATLQANEPWCWGHVASVWYRYTAPAEQTLTVSVPGAEPNTRVCVLPDSIGAGSYRTISPSETVSILVDAGRTYFILLGSMDPATPATLDLTVGPPYFDLTVTVDKTGVADHISGAAVVGGTLTCTGSAPVDLEVRVQEKVTSRKSVDMSDWKFAIPCSTTTTRWQMRLSSNVAYVPGNATVSVYAGGGDDVDRSTTTVKLGAK